MINGAHAIIYSTDADADRAFLRDILGLPHVDVGGGWLIFGLPPSEVAVHPTGNDGASHELYFMCADVEELRAQLSEHDVESSPVENLGWGLVTQVTLPGGGKIGVYQPRHERPASASVGGAKRKTAKRAVKKKKTAVAAAPKGKKVAKRGVKKKAVKRGRAKY